MSDIPSTESALSGSALSGPADSAPAESLDNLLQQPVKVINAGLEGFALELEAAAVEVVQLDWRPPADGDPVLAALLSKLGS